MVHLRKSSAGRSLLLSDDMIGQIIANSDNDWRTVDSKFEKIALAVETVKEQHGNLESLSVGHAMAPDIDAFVEELHSVTDLSEVRVDVIGPVVASHGSPGLVAVSFVLKK